jgi:hypothetical protein
MLAMFAENIRSSTLRYHAAGSNEPFREMTSLSERPMAMVVPWAQSPISKQDHELVTELVRHLAAALVLNLSE